MQSLILHGMRELSTVPGIQEELTQFLLNGCILFSFSSLHLLKTVYLGTSSAAFTPQSYTPQWQNKQVIGNQNVYLMFHAPLLTSSYILGKTSNTWHVIRAQFIRAEWTMLLRFCLHRWKVIRFLLPAPDTPRIICVSLFSFSYPPMHSLVHLTNIY